MYTLSSFSTYYGGTLPNRAFNIKLAASKLNNIKLKSMEIFDYYHYIGRPTASAGFKPAPVYVNGKDVIGIGGGLCQVATTVYNAALLSGLQIIERHNHSKPVPYIALGLDATVSYGSLDLKFKNNTTSEITIKATADGNTLNFTFVSDTPKQFTYSIYTVKISPRIVDTYRNTFKNGVKIKTEFISRSTYLFL